MMLMPSSRQYDATNSINLGSVCRMASSCETPPAHQCSDASKSGAKMYTTEIAVTPVEVAPAPNLDDSIRHAIWDSAIAIGRAAGLDNAGTVEFLYDVDGKKFYFIEVNPRIQVEHTVTEEITGYDLIQSQLLIAQGRPLSDSEIGLGDQSKIVQHGFAIQCRVTTEDPTNKFVPNHGRLSHYRSTGGLGIRLDAGTAFTGAVITPFYDSMLVKVTAHGLRFVDAARRMERGLQEFRIRGVKTNIPFLINLVKHDAFLAGKCTTRFLDETPALFQLPERKDRATKLLTYIGEVIVNGQRIPVTLQDPKRLRHGAGAEGQAGGRATLTSPMPGKVVRLLAAVGDEVAEGQGVLVVEAMKMQNEVQAPKAGKVAAISVSEGQTVNAGESLAIIE